MKKRGKFWYVVGIGKEDAHWVVRKRFIGERVREESDVTHGRYGGYSSGRFEFTKDGDSRYFFNVKLSKKRPKP